MRKERFKNIDGSIWERDENNINEKVYEDGKWDENLMIIYENEIW